MKKKTSSRLAVFIGLALLVLMGGLSQLYLKNNLTVSAGAGHSHAHTNEESEGGDHADEGSEADTAIAAGKNLVSNYSFEVGTGLDIYGWQPGGEDPGTSAWRDTSISAYGFSSAALRARDVSPGTNLAWSQRITEVPAGKDVTVKGSIKTEDLHGTAFLIVTGSKDDAQYSIPLTWYVLDAVTGTADWQTVQGSVYLPPEVNAVTVSAGLYGEGTAWFDEISLIASEHVPSPLPLDSNLLNNPDFSQGTLGWQYFSVPETPRVEWGITDGGGGFGPSLSLTQGQLVGQAYYSGFFQVINGLSRTRHGAVFSGWLRLEGLEGEAWLSLVSYGVDGRSTSESVLADSSTRGWQRLELSVEIPEKADSIWVSFTFSGKGTVFFDDLDFRLTPAR